MRGPFTTMVIDEENLIRDGICALLNAESATSVVAAARSVEEIDKLPFNLDPDLLVMDFPGTQAQVALTAVRRRWPKARIIVLTFRREDRFIEAAFRAGADGYVLKTDERQQLANAVSSVMTGNRYVSASVFDRVVTGFAQKLGRGTGSTDGLSDREREVMKQIARGLRTREIAEHLSLSQKTIEKHRSNLMRKLGLRTATAVAAFAIAQGYLDQ